MVRAKPRTAHVVVLVALVLFNVGFFGITRLVKFEKRGIVEPQNVSEALGIVFGDLEEPRLHFYYFNLDHRQDRRQSMETSLADVGIKAERFSAVWGVEDPSVRARLKKVRRECRIDWNSHQCQKFFTKARSTGIVGLALTWDHLARHLLGNARKLGIGGDDVIVVFEDDLKWHPLKDEAPLTVIKKVVARTAMMNANWKTIRLGCVGDVQTGWTEIRRPLDICPMFKCQFCGGTGVVLVKFRNLAALARSFLKPPLDDIDCGLFQDEPGHFCVNIRENGHEFVRNFKHKAVGASDIPKEPLVSREQALRIPGVSTEPPRILNYRPR